MIRLNKMRMHFLKSLVLKEIKIVRKEMETSRDRLDTQAAQAFDKFNWNQLDPLLTRYLARCRSYQLMQSLKFSATLPFFHDYYKQNELKNEFLKLKGKWMKKINYFKKFVHKDEKFPEGEKFDEMTQEESLAIKPTVKDTKTYSMVLTYNLNLD